MPRANDLSPLIHAQHARAGARAEQLRTTPWGAASRPRRALWQRVLAGAVALSLWLSPLSLTIEQARNAAGVLGAGAFSWTRLDDRQAVQAMLPRLQLGFGIPSAQAAPIADPNAPITFRPTITQSTGANGGVPVVNIAAPNANGISLNQYQQFNIDPIGLILNNSMLSGTSLTGGQVAANPNLTSRAASLIVNQVTSTGSAFASALNGPLEVFGTPATVVIANPNGISTLGTAFTNTPSVILTTGVPQMLTQVGGSATSFDNATAVGYNVTGGHIQIEGNAGANGPGAGIDGTVGNIDLIAETIGIDAPLYAGTKINAIAGDQMVTPASIDSTGGTTYSTSSNGSANTAAAITAATNGAQSYAIDATAYGAVTAGEIQLVGTPAGLGVQLDAQMTANTGNLQIASNGDLTLAGSAAQTQATLQSAGNIALTGSHLSAGGYTINANGDLTSTGTLQAGTDLSITAGGNVNLASAAANGNVSINTGDTLTAGELTGGGTLSATAQNAIQLNGLTQSGSDMNLDAVNGTLTAAAALNSVGNLTANAGQDIVIGAQATVGNNATLSAGQDAQFNSALAVGGALSASAGGNLSVSGALQSGAAMTLTAAQQITLPGSLIASGTLTAHAGGTLNLSGSAAGLADINLSSAQDIAMSGLVLSQGNTTLNAGGDINLTGTVATPQGGIAMTAGGNVDVEGSLNTNSTLAIQADGSSGITLGGTVSTVGDATLTSASAISVGGTASMQVGGALTTTAASGTQVAGSLTSAGNMTLTSTSGDLDLSGTLESGGDMTLSAAAGNLSTSGNNAVGGNLNASAGQAITLGGLTSVTGNSTVTAGQTLSFTDSLIDEGNGTFTAGTDINGAGSLGVNQLAQLNAGGNIALTGTLTAGNLNAVAGNDAAFVNLQTSGTLAITADGNAGEGDVTLSGIVNATGAMTLQAARDIDVTGSVATGSTAALNATGDVNVSGALQSTSDMTLTASGAIDASGALTSGTSVTATAAQGVTLNNVQAATTLSAHANGGDLNVTGTATALGAVALNASGDTNISGVLGGTTVGVTSQGNLNVTGSIQSSSDMTLNAVNGSLTTTASGSTGGNLTSAGNLTASAGQNLALGAMTTVALNTTLSAGQTLTQNGTLAGYGTGQLSSGADIDGSGTSAFSLATTLNAGGNIDLSGALQGGTLNANSVGNMTLTHAVTTGTPDANGNLQLNGTFVANAGQSLTLAGQSLANGTATLTSGQDMTLGGLFNTGDVATLTVGQDLSVTGQVASATTLNAQVTGNVTVAAAGTLGSLGDMTVNAQTGSLTVNGGLNSGGALTATSGQATAFAQGSTVSAVNALSLTAGSTMALDGTLIGQAAGTLTSGGDMTGAGTQAITQNAVLNAGGNLSLTGSLQAAQVQATAAGSAALNNVTTTTTLALSANGGDATLNGTVSVPGTLTLQASQDAIVNGAVTAGSTVALTGGSNATVNGSIVAQSDVTLSAMEGTTQGTAAINTGGSVVTNGNLSLSGQNVTVNGSATVNGSTASDGTVTSPGNTRLTASQAITVGGTVSGQGSGTLSAGTDIDGAGIMAFGAAAQVTAGGNVALTGGLQGTSVQVTGAGNAGVGTVQATAGNVTLTAQGQDGAGNVTATGNVIATGAVTLNAPGLINVAGLIGSGTDTTLQSGGSMTVTGGVDATGALTATSGGSMTLGSAASVGDMNLLANTAGSSITINGALYSGGLTHLQAAQDIAVGGALNGTTTVMLNAGRNLTLGSTLSTGGDVQLTATSGALSSADTISTQGNLTTTSGGATSLNGALINGNTTVNAGGNLTVAGSDSGLGTGTFTAGGSLTGGGTLSYQGNLSLAAQSIDPPNIQTAGAFSATSAGSLDFGTVTAVGNVTLDSTAGGVTLEGLLTTGGTLNATAAQDITANAGIDAVGTVTMTAGGNLSASAFSTDAAVTLQAGQTLTVAGTNEIAGETALSANAIVLSGTMTAEQDFTATASSGSSGSIDTSAAQLNVTGNATLSGYNVNTGGLLIGGNLSETAAHQVTLSGKTMVEGTATIGNGATVQTNASVLSGGTLTVDASTVNVSSAGSLASTDTTNVTAGTLNNQGSIDGTNTTVTVSGGMTNSGSVMGEDSLNVTANTLNNNNGLLFAGDLTSTTGNGANLNLTVTGGNGGFSDSGGQILAQGNLTMTLANMALDPSASTMGTVGAGSQMTITAASMSLGSNWSPSANVVTLNATNGFTNNGTLSVTNALNISTNGYLTNNGTIASAGTLNLSGVIANASNATLYSGSTMTLGGYQLSNSGTVESVGNLNANLTNLENQGGTVLAQGNSNLQISNDLNNTGGTIQVGGNLTLAANTVENNQTAPTGTTTTTTAVTDSSLLLSSTVGIDQTNEFTMTLGDLLSPDGIQNTSECGGCSLSTAAAVAGSGNVTFNAYNEVVGYSSQEGDPEYGYVWVPTTGGAGGSYSFTLTLPTVYQTTTTQQVGTAGVISAGSALSITANSLSNLGGEIAAGGNLNLNIQSLGNGAVAPTMTSQTTDSVDQSQLSAFLAAFIAGANQALPGSFRTSAGINISTPDLDTVSIVPGPSCFPETDCSQDLNQTVYGIAPTSTSTVTYSSPTGLIISGGNMTIAGGNLTNAGTIYAGQNLSISAASLTNQGSYSSETTTTSGCAPGVSFAQCSNGTTYRGENPTSSTFSYQQDNATIAAGGDLLIAAGTITNTYGNIIAGHDIYIGGVGSTASSLTPANTLTNTSGNIVAGNNIDLDVSGALTNTLPPPALVHEDYGSLVAYNGCMTAGGYKESYCEAYVEQQSGNSSNISAGNGLTINAGSLTNVGSQISAGQSATINVTGPIVNSEQTLNAYWHSEWVQETSLFSSDKRHNIWACGSVAECTAIYGSAYTSVGGVIDPPTPVGNIAATIQAPNLSITSGGQIQNVGNLLGSTVTLTGTKLINGITGNLYTPSVSTPSQVISLAPATSGGMSLSLPNVANTGSSSASGGVTYVISSPGGTSAAQIGPANLIEALPASLQPSTDLFYYNPQEQDLVLQQAALTQTGEASFINCLSCSASGLSVADQDTALLYQNAVTFATANSIQLGTALTQSQIASLTQPILWYVDETVPDPSCTATGGATCPTVTALMPQVYLPPNYNAQTAEGNIEGSNVTLNFDGSGGSVLNTGNITASNTLTVNTPTLTNQQNSTNVGQIWNYIQDTGYEETTGTMAQPGGTMSAGNMVLNVQAVNQIGGALQELNTDGSVDTAATQQLLSTLQAQLGSAFQQSTVTNDLNTSFVKEGGDFSANELMAMVVAVAASIVTAGAAAAAMGATLATMSLPEAMIAAAASGMVSSAVSQGIMGDGFSLGKVFEAGAVGAITAGLTDGITYNSTTGEFGFTPLNQGLNSLPQNVSTLGQLAGISTVGNTLAGTVPQAGEAAAETLPTELAALGADAVISSGVQTAIEGGNFLNNLKTDAVNDGAADLAYAIGDSSTPLTAQNILEHAALGCAASAAEGTGCEGGAIGAASSAVITPFILDGVTNPNASGLNSGQIAAVGALATLTGSITAGLAGQNAQAGAQWAQNEALNNDTASWAHALAAEGAAQGVIGTIGQVASSATSTIEGWFTRSAINSAEQTALMAADVLNVMSAATDPTIPITPQSTLGQSIQQNGVVATAQAVGNGLLTTGKAVASGDPQTIVSLAGGAVPGLLLGGITGAGGALVDGLGAEGLSVAGSNIDELGSLTATGSNITNSEGMTIVGSDPVSLRVATNVAPSTNAFDVIVHGAPYDDSGAAFMVDGLPTNANQIAEAILSNPSWNGQSIRLLTCYGGCGPAQDLSNILKVPVEGATGPVGVLQVPNSVPVVGQGGHWINFLPTGDAE